MSHLKLLGLARLELFAKCDEKKTERYMLNYLDQLCILNMDQYSFIPYAMQA